MVVFVSAIIAYVVTVVYGQRHVLRLTGSVEEGLPSWQLPWLRGRHSNDTTALPNPLEMAEDFGFGLFLVPFVAVLQHLAIAKFYTGI